MLVVSRRSSRVAAVRPGPNTLVRPAAVRRQEAVGEELGGVHRLAGDGLLLTVGEDGRLVRVRVRVRVRS